MLTFITFKWKQPQGFKTYFNSKHVNVLYHSIKRNITVPFQFCAITDDSKGLDPGIISVPVWDSPDVPATIHPFKPNCYRRLKLFSKDIGEYLQVCTGGRLHNPKRFVALDLDVVITGDITEICSVPGEFVGWRRKLLPYQGAFFMLKPGARPQVWDEFIRDPGAIIKRSRVLGYHGTDQAVVSAILGTEESVLTSRDGIYHFATELRKMPRKIPEACKIAIFHGTWSPWHDQMFKGYAWVQEHWRI